MADAALNHPVASAPAIKREDWHARLDALAVVSRRSKSFLAAEAIARFVDAEEWQLGEIKAGLADSDQGSTITHERVSKWLKSWGTPSEGKAPR